MATPYEPLIKYLQGFGKVSFGEAVNYPADSKYVKGNSLEVILDDQLVGNVIYYWYGMKDEMRISHITASLSKIPGYVNPVNPQQGVILRASESQSEYFPKREIFSKHQRKNNIKSTPLYRQDTHPIPFANYEIDGDLRRRDSHAYNAAKQLFEKTKTGKIEDLHKLLSPDDEILDEDPAISAANQQRAYQKNSSSRTLIISTSNTGMSFIGRRYNYSGYNGQGNKANFSQRGGYLNSSDLARMGGRVPYLKEATPAEKKLIEEASKNPNKKGASKKGRRQARRHGN